MGHNLQVPDSTQSRDHKEDHINLPVKAEPTIDTYLTVRPRIVLFQQNYFDELDIISTHIADTIYAAQNFYNPSVTVSTLHVYDTPIVCQDQQLQEFQDGEECCQNFMTDAEDKHSIISDSTDESILTVIENDQSQEVDSIPASTLATALTEDFVHMDYDHTPIQFVQLSLIQPLRKSKDRERRIPTLV